MHMIDRVIAVVSPTAAVKRARARAVLRVMNGATAKYDGATVSRRAAGWRRVSTDANAETGMGALERLRDASRDLVRNNPYAARGISIIAHNVVGAGILPQFSGATDALTKVVEGLAVLHLDTPCVDASGQLDLYGLQSLLMRSVAESGEVLVRRRRRRPVDGLPLPFALQVLESDFLDSSKSGPMPNGNIAVQGVEFGSIGQRVAYWMFDEHPGATGYPRMPQSRRVPASEVVHMYRVDRPGQVRGVPWLAPVILRMNDFADYEDAQLMRQKIAACFAAFVSDGSGSGGYGPGGSDGTAADASLEALEPGIIETLPPGKEITFANPPGVDGYMDYSRAQLHAIAAGIGITYEALTGDLSQVNYSSMRAGRLEFMRSVDAWQQHIMISQFCRRLEAWFAEGVAVQTGNAAPVTATWTPPKREMIDPTKEIPAQRDAIRSGQTTLSDVIRANGKDPARHFEELAADAQELDRLGLVLDCDPRKTVKTGAVQARDITQNQETADA